MHILRSIAVISLLSLAGCGGLVAADAPALLTMDEITAQRAASADSTRGVQAASNLATRGARLRARAARLQRAGLDDAERRRLLERAER
ncbi:hypothetical protein [Pararhodobacter oceanensis]|uniref:Uncharacterized protein n=1 Tax=Pararhodobacter oceanensis TaxID=2172121 RepID=A0A2T8HY08_9RHOB|nr:hypothetical protein [Pararhodobacter oceanensis]PVH30318.1 hypothetical protein DDE20_01820 [Pararhodobacter oceanensis]